MSERSDTNREVRPLRRKLREIVKLAREASLTGSLQGGARSSVLQYNRVIAHLERIEALPPGLFPPLPEDTGFDEVGVAAAQLAGFLREDEEDEEPRTRAARGNHNVHINFGGKDASELRELGQVIREHLPEWLRGKVPQAAAQAPEASLTEIESRLAEVGAKLQAVAEQLRRGDLSDAQRAELAEQLSRLGHEQARLARRHAELRESEAV